MAGWGHQRRGPAEPRRLVPDFPMQQAAPGSWGPRRTPRPELCPQGSTSELAPELRPSQASFPPAQRSQKTCPRSPPTRPGSMTSRPGASLGFLGTEGSLGSPQWTGTPRGPSLGPHLSCGSKCLGWAEAAHSWTLSPIGHAAHQHGCWDDDPNQMGPFNGAGLWRPSPPGRWGLGLP